MNNPSFARRAGAVALAGMLIASLSGCDRLLGADRRIARAAEEYEAGRYADAMVDLKTALEAEPDHIAGRILLARVSLQLGDPDGARKELDRAIAAGADEAALRDLHYEIFLRQGRNQDALIAARADEQLDPLRRAIILATAQTRLGQIEDAGRSIEEAAKLGAEGRELEMLRASWHWAAGQLTEAEAVLAALVTREPDAADAWFLKGRIAFGAGQTRAALDAFEQAKKTTGGRLSLPEQYAVDAGIVESWLALGDLERAESALKALDRQARDAFMTRYLRARIALMRGDHRAAVGELQRALSRQPDQPAARLLLGAALLQQGSLEQADAELSKLLAEQPNNVEARKLLARVLLARGDLPGANRLMANTPVGDAADVSTQWLSGAVMVLSGETAGGIARLEAAVAEAPDNALLRLDLAGAYLMAGRRNEAVAALAAVPAGAGGRKRRELEVLIEISGLDAAAARRRVQQLIRENPKDPDLLNAGGRYLLSISDAVGAATVLRDATRLAPQNVEARMGLAAAHLYQGDVASAEGELRRVIELEPANETAYIGLARAALIRADRAAARKVLEEAIGKNPGAVEARLLLADVAHGEGDAARMRALMQQALSVSANRGATQSRIGQVLMRGAMYDEALTRFNEAASLGVDEAGVYAGLALIAMQRPQEGRARLESASSRRRDWAFPVGYLVALDVGEKKFEPALARVSAFERAGGAVPVAEEMRGDIQLAAGRFAQAVVHLQRAASQRPSAALAVKLFRARSGARTPAPDKVLREWLEIQPGEQFVRFLLAEHAHKSGQRKTAIAEYEKALAIAPHPSVLNNLAWLYYEEGDRRAVDFARRAHEARPDDAAIADTYGWVLVERGNVAEGLPLLEKAVRAAPNHPEIRYHYAVALARSGSPDRARATLQSLLQAAPEFASRQDAEALFNRLSGG